MLFLLKTLFVIDALMIIGVVLFRWGLAPQYKGVVSAKIVALALFTPVVALFCGNLFIFCGYLVLVVAFNSRSRAELASTYVFLLPLMPMLTRETGVGTIYLLAVSAVLAMNFGALISFLVTTGRRSLALARYDFVVVLLICMFVFIFYREAGATNLLRGFTVYIISFAGPYLLVSRAITTRTELERLLLHLCLGATLTSVAACFQARWHWVVFEAYYQSLHVPLPIVSASLSMRAGLLRTGGSMIDYSAGGLFLATVLVLMPALRSRFRQIGFWSIMTVIVAGLILTQSRGAWVAAIVGVMFLFAYRGQWTRVVTLAGAAVIGEVMVLLFATSGRLALIAGQTSEASNNVIYRQQLASRGIQEILSHPLFGQSPEQLVANMQELIQGQHIVDFVNAHLFVAMAAGVPLFILWCWTWAMPVAESWRRRHGENGLMGAPAFIIVPAMVALTFTSPIDRNLVWPTIALALVVLACGSDNYDLHRLCKPCPNQQALLLQPAA